MTLENILVTGGAGFIGSHTVELLLRQGKQVTVLDNLYSGHLTNLDLTHPQLTFIEGDVLHYDLVKELVAANDAVLHLAAIASVPYSIDHPIYSTQVNSQGLLHVLEAIRRVNPAIRLVYASSAAVYGDGAALPCVDTKPLSTSALSPYALQKMQTEQFADLYTRLFGLSTLGLRYFNVYGKRQDPKSPYSGVISRFLDAYTQNQPLTVFGDGKQSRDFIHVSDVANANCAALQSTAAGAVNIATGTPKSLLQLIDSISQAGAKPAQIDFQPERKGDIKESYASIETAIESLRFRSSVTLDAGIKELLTPTTA